MGHQQMGLLPEVVRVCISSADALCRPRAFQKFGQNASLRALRAHQLLHHVQQTHGDAEFTFDNIELGPVSLVAVLHSIKVQATNTVFTLHDGWGQVEARTWKDGEVSAEDEEEMNKADGVE